MWILKLTSTKSDGSCGEILYQCDSFEVTRFLPGTLARKDLAESNNLTIQGLDTAGLGILIRMFNHRDGRRCVDRHDIWIPRDCETIHVLHPDTGKIVNGYRWPTTLKPGDQPPPSWGVASPPPFAEDPGLSRDEDPNPQR